MPFTAVLIYVGRDEKAHTRILTHPYVSLLVLIEKIFDARLLVKIGEVSYTLYLVHFPIVMCWSECFNQQLTMMGWRISTG